MTEEIDFELVDAISLEIDDRFRLLMKLISKDNDSQLKHLTCCAIHLMYFMKDVYEKSNNESPTEKDKKLLDKFLKHCGCEHEK